MGLQPLTMPADEATDLLYSMIVDDVLTGRGHARVAVDTYIGQVHVPKTVQQDLDEMRRTWGQLPEHQAALGRAVALTATGGAS